MNLDKPLAAHILRTLASAQAAGRVLALDELAGRVDARRDEVRTVVSQLHLEGHVDALTLRPTWTGLALAAAFRRAKVKPLSSARRTQRLDTIAA